MTNTEVLHGRVADLDLHRRPDRQRSRGLLDEVATGKVTGEEEYWSRTDLWDFQANVDGARGGLRRPSPVLKQKKPDLDRPDRGNVRGSPGAARRSTGWRRVRDLRQAHQGGGQGALRRGQRAVRAAVEADRGGRLNQELTA